jgi:hypothetical protein
MKLVQFKIRLPDFLFFIKFNEILKIIYAAHSPLVYVLYEILPELVVKFQLHLQQTSE